MRGFLGTLAVLGFLMLLPAAEPKPADGVLTLFDFEQPDDLKVWSNLELPDPKQKEPAARFELSPDHASSGKHSLKITFVGGRWPTLTTTQVPDDWEAYQTFQADVWATRTGVMGFTVLQEGSKRGGNYDGAVSRWTKTELVQPGRNRITGLLRPNGWSAVRRKLENGKELGKVVRFEIFMYAPAEGETLYVDNIRLATAKVTPPPAVKTPFKVVGTDLVVGDVQELGKKLADRWSKPQPRTLEQVETAFQERHAQLKMKHPRAVLAVLRDGEKGFDPAHPDKAYAGWKDAYWSSHGPDSMTVERATNQGKHAAQEVFMRHRSPLMRVDLSSIPPGSEILAAQLVVIRARPIAKDRSPEEQPTMWAVEPCNRPWDEHEVNAYEYARGKFWKEIGGRYYDEDPDFLPVYLAHGPGSGQVNVWDFTEAVKFWTNGKQANHGFMLHGDSKDYLFAHTREAAEVKLRPAVLVSYLPAR